MGLDLGDVLTIANTIFSDKLDPDALKRTGAELIAGRGMETICHHLADSDDPKVVAWRKAVAEEAGIPDCSAMLRIMARQAKLITP